MDIHLLVQMSKQFSEAFEQLFVNTDINLERILKQKLRASRTVKKVPGNVLDTYEELMNYRASKISVTREEVNKKL